MKTPRKLFSLLLALLFFLDTTVFLNVRAVAAQRPVGPVLPSGELVPYHVPSPEEALEQVRAGLESFVSAEPVATSSIPEPVLAATQSPSAVSPRTTRESVSSAEEQGDRRSNAPSVSSDGRYVAFESEARNLVPGDRNKKKDVFVRDRWLGTTTRVSVATSGGEANDDSGEPAISGDGRFVAFESKASNLTPRDKNKRWDIFLHDRDTSETFAVTQGNGNSHDPAISADGRFVAFESDASNLVAGDTGGRRDIFVYDRETHEMRLASVSSGGAQGNRDASDASISGDGRSVAFDSKASNLVPGDSNHLEDVFVHDLETGETTIASVASTGTLSDRRSERPSISADGQFVAFESSARNLVPGLPIVHEASKKSKNEREDHGRRRRRSYHDEDDDSGHDDHDDDSDDDDSDDDDDDSDDDDDGLTQIYVHDQQTGLTVLVSQSTDGTAGDKKSSEASIDASGRFVAFASKARNLVSDDTNHQEDVFVRDLTREITVRGSVGYKGQGDKDSGRPSISADGSLVGYESSARNLVAGDTNQQDDVFSTESGLNRPPQAVDDRASTPVNTPTDIVVLANDDDPDGDPLTVDAVDSSSGAVLEILDDGAVRYLPPLDFVGTDTFVYTVSDGHGGKATATVTVDVSGGNEPPQVEAGADQQIFLPLDTTTLTGTVTDDGLPAGGTLSVQWSLFDGPAPVTFGTPHGVVTTARFSIPGTYVLQLDADDGALAAFDRVTVVLRPANAAPLVNAGADQTLVMPGNVASLLGTVTDDGEPAGTLSVLWSEVQGPPGVVFSSAASVATQAAFPSTGTYVLRLTADDGALTAFDEITVTVEPPIPDISISSVAVTEGQHGSSFATLNVELSTATERLVSVDYGTLDGTAGSCDYLPRGGTVSFAPGELSHTVVIPVAGDLVIEGDESFFVQLANAVGGTLAIDRATVTIVDDDLSNAPPTSPSNRLPENHSLGLLATPTLSWSATDPDPADVLAFDVYLGTAFDLVGQAWSKTCATGAEPAPRSETAASYDDGSDRLIVVGGLSSGGDLLFDVWVLDSASGAGAAPSWRTVDAGAGPSARRSATLALDRESGRAVLFGGCEGACDDGLADTWLLDDGLSPSGTPSWQPLPDAPVARLGHSAAYSEESGRMMVFGGAAAAIGPDSSEVWILTDATSPTSAAWQLLPVSGATPPGRRDAATAYDPETDRLFVLGGRNAAGEVLDDLWVLQRASGATGDASWTRVMPSGSVPPPRSGAVLVYDAPSDRLLLTNGASALYTFDDAWILQGPERATPTWSPVTPMSDPPTGRSQAAFGYSPANARLVLALGASPLHPEGLSDVWQLSNPVGSLPLVADGQPDESFAAGPLPEDTVHYWRVVTRDPQGAFQGSSVYRFTPGAPRIAVGDASTTEGDAGSHALDFTLSLSSPRETEVTVDWMTADGTAAADEDYVPAGGTATFAPGTTSTIASVEILGDTWPETNETFALTLVNPQGGSLDSTTATGTILDDDEGNDPPTVDAGPDQTVDPGAAALGGSASDDGLPLPSTLTTLWSQVSGPAPVTFADPTSLDTTVTLSEPGIYVLRLTASDGALEASDDVTLEVRGTNAPPVVSAGPDQSLLAPATSTTLSGFASDDGLPDGSTVTTLWTLVSGPDTVTFSDPTSLTTSVTLGAPGVYEFLLTASDGALSENDDVKVSLLQPNAPPLVSAGPDQALVLPVLEADLPGTASDDGFPGTGLTTEWSQVSGPPGVVFDDPTAPATRATFPVSGSYVLRLLASDGALSSFDEATVTVGDVVDLVVDAVDASGSAVDGQTLAVSGPILVTLHNAGVGSSGPFQVAFFEDRDRNGAYDAGTDELLGTIDHPGLAAGESDTIEGTLDATLLFVGNLVWAFADSAEMVAESDETNNYGSSAPPCEPNPSPLPFSPVEEWAWTQTSVSPTYTNVMSTPAVADLNLDGIPDVVFASFVGSSYTSPGILRALSGSDGGELFSATETGSHVNAVTNVAVGDIDGDGLPEIVTMQGFRLIAFENDGTRKWLGDAVQVGSWGGPSLADLNGDGVPEIVLGRSVFNADGTLRWTGTGTNGDLAGTGPLSIVADLDTDGSQEVIAGPTAYRADGQIYWRAAGLPDGGTAVGNFDADPDPEIVLTGSGRVWLLEHDGTVKWGPVIHPGGGVPGAPTVADFDGDGKPEIGVAGAIRYAVFDTDGKVLWSAVTRDLSSSRTGSSVFDFEGDGSAEVVYRDEVNLFVFRGKDGAVLFRTSLSSCTTYEYPLVVDVDGDGNAEIVTPANDTCGYGPSTGIHVFGDANDQWVATRRIWNQHTYHITNVNEDATIPRNEAPGWLNYNSYRQNELTSGCAFAQPDVTASYVRVEKAGANVSLIARIGNRGISVGRVLASFYDGDPRNGGRLLGTTRTLSTLSTGSYEDVTLQVSPEEQAYPLWVVADDRGDGIGELAESNEENNFYGSPVDLIPTANEGPSVDAGPDQTTPPGSALLSGEVTDDGLPRGTLVTVWTLVSGAGKVTFADSSQPATTASFIEPGLYVLRLTASDGDLTAQDDVAVTVTPANVAPVVDAGPDTAVTLPASTASLQGQASDDGLPSGTLTTLWSQVGGPAAVGFGDPSAAATTVTASVVGIYVLRLTASDGALESSDEVTLRVGDASSLPDLTVASVDTSGILVDDLSFALDGVVTAFVSNPGLAPATAPFTLTLFEDRNGNRSFDRLEDSTLATTDLPSLGVGVTQPVSLPVSGSLLFRGNRVYAFVDSGAVIVESNEGNNYGSSAPPSCATGSIVVANDEWTLTNTGFAAPNDAGVFVANLTRWFTGGLPGRFHAYSTDHGVAESALASAMASAGHEWTKQSTTPRPFDLATLRMFDGIFLAGNAPAAPDYTQILIDYVDGGGNVYLAGGTGAGGATVEAERWNPFLNHFGLSFTSPYNGVGGSIAIGSTHPIFHNVHHLFQNNGNSIVELSPESPANEILVSSPRGGLYALHTPSAPAGTPGCATTLPDLVAGHLRITSDATEWGLTARVGNAGGHEASSFDVTFYDGEPFPNGVPLGTLSTSGLIPQGGFEDVTLSLPLATSTRHTIWVVADDNGYGNGQVRESDELNNAYDSGRVLSATTGLPDLAPVSFDLTDAAADPRTLEVLGSASVEVSNQGDTAAGAFEITVFADRDRDGALGPGDLVLGSASFSGADAGAVVTVPIDLSGTLLFASEPLFAFVDSGETITESNEDNNVTKAGETCTLRTSFSDFTLRVERAWLGSTVSPTATGVGNTPLVIDLDGDGRPEIVFASHVGTNINSGPLRAIRGRDGSEVFTTSTIVRARAQLAAGDIDGDGRPEIVAVANSATALVAFEDDGTVKWTSAPVENVTDGGVSIANIDGLGLPEIIVGRQVVDAADGSVRWTGSASYGGVGNHRMSSVADLDGDGTPEVIAGNTAYRADGSTAWTAVGAPDGFTAVADVDGDGLPEVILTNINGTWCLENDGTLKWGPLRAGSGSYGAPPVIADIDGDRAPEAVVSINTLLVAIDGLAGTPYVRWSLAANQSWEAMPAAFDFDRDGASEVVFTDGSGLRVLNGSNGQILGELPIGSFTTRAGVVVADVDADGSAEIVSGASAFAGGTTTPGLYVVGETNGQFPTARGIWNQVAYHVTNVNDDGTIPLEETPSWLGPNSYRANVSTSSERFGAADLSASYPRSVAASGALELTLRIGNSGSVAVAAGVAVSFYDGHPRERGVLLGTTTTTQDLAPGEYEDVTLNLPAGAFIGRTVWAVADDEGGLVSRYAECDEENNFLDTGLSLNEAPVVDAGTDQTVVFPDDTATLNGTVDDDGLPAGVPLSLRWSQLSGPGLALFADPTAADTSVRFTRSGLYVLRLTASDSFLVRADDVTITVTGPNAPPVVDAGPDAIVPDPNDTHMLDGTVSDDGLPLGSSVTHQWTQVSGPAAAVFVDANALVTTVQLPVVGAYVLRLTASDTALTGFDEVTLTRLPPNQAPVVEAGPDVKLSLPANTVTLSGSASDDSQPVGAALTYTWTVLSGPGSVLFSTPGSPTTQASFGSLGIYHLRLSVSDTELTGSDEIEVELLPKNEPPAVDARPDREIDAAETLLIEAAVSDDGLPLPTSLSLSWSKVSGPGVVVFSDPDAVTTTVQFGQAGSYVLRLTANDGELEASDDVTVTVRAGNLAPIVNAGPDRTLQQPASMLTLNGSASDDGLPAGSSLTVSWSVVSAPGPVVFTTPSAAVTKVSFTVAGTYVLRLTATDTEATRSDDVIVEVLAQNKAPLVNAGPDQNLVAPPAALIVLAGSVVDDGLPVGSSVVSVWQQLSGPAAVVIADPSNPVTTTSLPALGVYVFRLRASDSLLQAYDDVTIKVADGNQPPTVDAGPDQTIVAPVYTATLSGVAADDGFPVGSSLFTEWSLVTGPALPTFADPTSPVTTVTLERPGTYVLRLVASDSVFTRIDTTSVTLQAAPPVGPPPIVEILSPDDGAPVTERAAIVGTVLSDALQRWTLEYRVAGDASWLLLGEGTDAVTASPLGELDPTLLLNGVYELRLTATDLAARTTRTSSSVVVRDNQKVGQFSVSFVDLEVPVAGLPIRITRTYDSRDKSRGDFGYGWRLSLSDVKLAEASVLGLAWAASTTPGGFPAYCLSLARSAVVTVTLPDGQTLEFEPKLNKECWQFVPPSSVTLSFRPRPGTVASLSALDGSDAFVTSSWPSPGQSGPATLVAATDFDYLDPDLYQLTLPDGRAFVVRQGKGLQSLTDANGNKLTVSPNGIQYQNPAVAGSTLGVSFVRDGQGRIESITDPLGNVLAYEYDVAGDLVTFRDREENETHFTYEPAFPHHLREIQDPLGRTPIRNEYYADGRLKSHTDAFNKTITYSHDLSARQEIVTDREGGIRVLDYDERGNVIREVDPEGRVVDRTFDARNNRLSETEPYDPASPPVPIPTTLYTYDAQDNLLSVTDPLGNRIESTYNAKKQVLTTKDARGFWTENSYDAKGNLTASRSGATTPGGPALSETSFTYDAQGNVKTQTVLAGGVPHVTSYSYDGSGNVVTETDAEGHSSSFTYDSLGNRKTMSTTRTTSSGSETLVTTYEYDREGRLTKTIDPDGSFTETVYDELGRRKETYDKLGHKTSYEYDLMGRPVKTTYPDDTTEESTYDGEGRRLTSTDRAGKITTYEYDKLGRLVKTIYPDTTSTENHYDAAGRLEWTKDARGKTTFFEYDSAGRRTVTRVPLGGGIFAETRFHYDASGNQDQVTDPEGRTTDYLYDALNRRVRTTFPELVAGGPRLFTETTYDELGRRVSQRDAAGKLTEFRYDKVGRLVRVSDAENQETAYGYDEVGNRTSQTDAEGRTTRFEYDSLGRQTKRILPGDATEEMTYDAAGNPKTRTDFAGRLTTYDYDVTNRLLTRSYPAAFADQNVSFSYWPTGQRKTVIDARGTTSYDYDARDRLKEIAYPNGSKLEYLWDGNGNRTSVTATLPSGLTLSTGYTYDDANRLDLVTDPAGRLYDHGYDKNGNRTSLIQPNDTVTSYTYDSMNRLTSLATIRVPTSTVIQSYALELGPAGNRTRITEGDGTIKQYGYDDVYRLTSETVSGLLNYGKNFVYDKVGNRREQTRSGADAGAPGTTAYEYDDRDRLLLEGSQPYTWDDNGNLTSKSGEATYTWDLENRLVRVEKTDGTVVEHAYDADGNRVRTEITPPTGPPTTTNFLVDTSGSLSQVVAETDATGGLLAYYVRGDDLLAVMRPLVPVPATPSDWQSRFYHADYIGSIRRLTNEAGFITDGYTYTAFGELIGHTGTDIQPYAFSGEPRDSTSGWQYHRARWMDPGTGRFVGMDPFEGVTSDPPSLHRYLYAHGRPVDSFDPTGELTLAQGLSVAAMISRIATTAIVSYRIIDILRLTATERITVEDAMYQLAELGRDQAFAYVGGHLINGAVKFLGVLPLSKLPQLLSQINRNRLKGKFAETLWGWANGATKNFSRVGGRIPDFIRNKVWDELKYYEGKGVMYLTKQLRDMTAYAARKNIVFNLHAIPGANVSADLASAVARTGGSIIYDLPRLEAQAYFMAGAAADAFVDAEDFWP